MKEVAFEENKSEERNERVTQGSPMLEGGPLGCAR